VKIESIKKMKSGKYKICLDSNESIITHDDVLIKNNIMTNKMLTLEEYRSLNKDKEYYDIYNKLVRMIGTKFRSEKEIREYLNKTDLEIERKEEAIKKLYNNGLINDKRFLKAYINDKVLLSTDGPNLIYKQLKEYGISESEIIESVDLIDKSLLKEKIEKLITKKIKNNTKYSVSILRKKIVDYVYHKGYEFEMINEIMSGFILEDKESIKKDYFRIKDKLEKKYSANELKYKIKEKLFSKGYVISQIDEIINNDY